MRLRASRPPTPLGVHRAGGPGGPAGQGEPGAVDCSSLVLGRCQLSGCGANTAGSLSFPSTPSCAGAEQGRQARRRRLSGGTSPSHPAPESRKAAARGGVSVTPHPRCRLCCRSSRSPSRSWSSPHRAAVRAACSTQVRRARPLRRTRPGGRRRGRMGTSGNVCPWRAGTGGSLTGGSWGWTAGLQDRENVFSFSGKKQDTWFIVDPKSGEKQTTLSTEAWDGLCPSSPLLYIGRTRKPVLLPVRPSSPRNGVLGGDLMPCSHPQSTSSPCMTPSRGSCAGMPPSPTTQHRSARSPTTTVSDRCACGSHGIQLPRQPARSGTLALRGPCSDAAMTSGSRLCRLLGKNGCCAGHSSRGSRTAGNSPRPVARLRGSGGGGQSPTASTAASPPPSGSA